MFNVRIAVCVLLGVLLNGCATMNQSECLTADWYAVGLEDGSRGQSASRLGRHREACAEYGVTPDVQRYSEGRSEGLENFCREASGFYQGKSGYVYSGVCPSYLEDEFLLGYTAGRDLYRLNLRIEHSHQAVEEKRSQIKHLRELVFTEEQRLIDDNSSEAQRKHSLHSIKRHRHRIVKLKGEIFDLENHCAALEHDYRQISRQFRY